MLSNPGGTEMGKIRSGGKDQVGWLIMCKLGGEGGGEGEGGAVQILYCK